MNISKSLSAGVMAAVVAISVSTSAVQAAPITLPTALNPGDHYRLAFVTSAGRDALSADIADYNVFVSGVAAGQAELAVLGTTWTVIGSTPTVDARDNTNTNPFVDGPGVPIYLLNDTILADDYGDLWDGSIDNPLNVTEDGSSTSSPVVTGTRVDGTANPGGNFLGGLVFARGGAGGETDARWVDGSFTAVGSNLPLYAMSGILTVETTAIAEPVPLGVMALGLISLILMRCKRIVPSALAPVLERI